MWCYINHMPWVSNFRPFFFFFFFFFCTKLWPRAATGGNYSSKAKYSNHFCCLVAVILFSCCKHEFYCKTVRVQYTTIHEWPSCEWCISAESYLHLIKIPSHFSTETVLLGKDACLLFTPPSLLTVIFEMIFIHVILLCLSGLIIVWCG